MEIAEPEQQQLGRYRIERTLGAGGMGVVYLARDTKLQRPVAIKKLRKDATSTTAAQRIQSEAQLLAQLNHPNIVHLHDVIEDGDGIALVMEYVEGTTLQQWMREYTPSLQQKLELLIQICNGLTEAHSLGIIHRDLKSDNILITENGKGGMTAKITDFGIAKSLQQHNETITREDHVAGTVDAMSPEQLQGYPLCPRSDLFSLGTIAYELLCSAKPFEKGEGGAMALAHKVVSEPHIPPQQAWPNLPEPLAVLLDKLLSKDPEHRPESAAHVAEALTFLHQQGADTDTREFSATVTQLLRKPPNKRKRTLGALAGLAVVASGGYWGWKEVTKLEPQYIAVLPPQIEGEAPPLTETLVQQAITDAVAQLESTSLVSLSVSKNREADPFNLARFSGATIAVNATAACKEKRCEISLEKTDTKNRRVLSQNSFLILPDRRQEAINQISSITIGLFDRKYHPTSPQFHSMEPEDYRIYLDILSRQTSSEYSDKDLSTLSALIGKYPKNPHLYFLYAKVSVQLFTITTESSYMDEARRVLYENTDELDDASMLLDAKLLVATANGSPDEVKLLIEKMSSLDYPSATQLTEYARLLYKTGAYEDSLHHAKKAFDMRPSADSLFVMAINETSKGNYETAKNFAEKLRSMYPTYWKAHSLLAGIYNEIGELNKAAQSILNIPEPLRNWGDFTNLGTTYALQQNNDSAVENYKKALNKNPNLQVVQLNIAEAYLKLGENEQADIHFNKLIELTEADTSPSGKRRRAISLAYLGDIQGALRLAHELTREHPDDTNIKYALAQIYIIAGELKSASIYIDELINQGTDPNWFSLPVFGTICEKKAATATTAAALCDR